MNIALNAMIHPVMRNKFIAVERGKLGSRGDGFRFIGLIWGFGP